MRLLFADDEEGLRALFRHAFESSGYEVTTVADGEAALDEVRSRALDLVVLDLHMPGMGGAEALRRILALRPRQKVVLISGSAVGWEAEDPEILASARAVLHKPFTLDELVATIEAALGDAPFQD